MSAKEQLLRIVGALAIIGWTTWCIHNGKIRWRWQRDGFKRREQPVAFWITVAIGFILGLSCLAAGVGLIPTRFRF